MEFTIDIFNIKAEERKEISKNKNPDKTYFEKELEFIKKEKTTTIFGIGPGDTKNKSINCDSTNTEETKDQKDRENFIDDYNNIKEKDNGKYNYIDQERSISTACNSTIMNGSELLNSFNNESRKIDKPIILIDINSINNESDQKIEEEARKIKDPKLNDYQKKLKILEKRNTQTEDIRDKNYDLNISAMIKEDENRKIEKINNLNDNYHNNYEKREKILKDEKSTTINLKHKNYEINQNNDYSNSIFDDNINDNSSIYLDETKDNTKADISENNLSNQEEESNIKIVKTFNPMKEYYYKKNNLYDLPLYEEKDESNNILIPEVYKIGKGHGYLYSNDTTTNFISKSTFLGDNKPIIKLSEKDTENRKFYDSIGLYFCGKEVKLENEKQVKRCCPNEFICKSCMDINKKKYNIKNNYLINIKGRVAKVNKGTYHCFGKFLNGNQIEDCINKFSCQACKMLDLFSRYYQ